MKTDKRFLVEVVAVSFSRDVNIDLQQQQLLIVPNSEHAILDLRFPNGCVVKVQPVYPEESKCLIDNWHESLAALKSSES